MQGICKDQLDSKLTTQFCRAKLVLNFYMAKLQCFQCVICSAATASYYTLSEHLFVTYPVFSIKRKKHYVAEHHSTVTISQFYYFQSFKQRRKGNSGFSFRFCLLASQTLPPVTQHILTCFVYYVLIFHCLSTSAAKQTKNWAVVLNVFSFPALLSSHFQVDFTVMQQRMFQ